jgi:hypothetical protein
MSNFVLNPDMSELPKALTTSGRGTRLETFAFQRDPETTSCNTMNSSLGALFRFDSSTAQPSKRRSLFDGSAKGFSVDAWSFNTSI